MIGAEGMVSGTWHWAKPVKVCWCQGPSQVNPGSEGKCSCSSSFLTPASRLLSTFYNSYEALNGELSLSNLPESTPQI